MDNSWFKIYRKIIDWEWFKDANTLKVFIYLLCVANFKNKSWRGMQLKPGDVITGRKQLAESVGMTEQQVRTILNRLKSTNEITIKTSPQGSIIHIVRYELYQISTNESTNNQPTINQQSTNNQPVYKNDIMNNDKNDRTNRVYSPADFKADLIKLGISEELTNDVMEHRKKCKGLFTQRAFSGLKKELDIFAAKENKPYSDALTFLIEQTTWRTFTYEYYSGRTSQSKPITNKKPTNTYGHIKDFGEVSTKW